MTMVINRQAVHTAAPLWMVVVRGTGAPYVELLTGADTAPYTLPQVNDLPAAVQAVRHEVIRYLAASPFPYARQVRDDVGLCLDEVLANAAEHTNSQVITITVDVLRQTIHHRDGVQVVVGDEERKRPTRRRPTNETVRGRGLMVLDGLSDWGVRRLAHGKEVWFRCPALNPTTAPPQDQP